MSTTRIHATLERNMIIDFSVPHDQMIPAVMEAFTDYAIKHGMPAPVVQTLEWVDKK